MIENIDKMSLTELDNLLSSLKKYAATAASMSGNILDQLNFYMDAIEEKKAEKFNEMNEIIGKKVKKEPEKQSGVIIDTEKRSPFYIPPKEEK